MFASTVLNYMDRQTMAQVGPLIKGEFGLRNEDFGWVMAAFSLTYAVFQVPAGFLVDRWDVRRTYAGAVAFWSLAGMSAAFSPTLGVLLVLRAILGVGESFNWPCALRATAQVLPPADRSLGNGIFNSGAAVGAVLTPLVVTKLADAYGWRVPFVVVGALGFVWVVVWLVVLGGDRRGLFRPSEATKPRPSRDPLEDPLPGLSIVARLTFGIVAVSTLLIGVSGLWLGLPAVWWAIAWMMFGTLMAARALPHHALKGADWAESLSAIVRARRFWVLVLVSISINVCWHFLISWLPTYLREDRKMTYLASGFLSAVPFLAADLGNLGGGALSRFFAGRGLGAVRGRIYVMALCTLLISSGAWVGQTRSDTAVVILLALMALGTAAFMANYFAFTQEVSSRHTGLIVGILGGLGNLCAAGILPFAGKIKDTTGGFGPMFILVGLVPFFGISALVLGWGSDAAARRDEELKVS
jgi:ACS family hexuronate transporter-like MFS transporter